MVPTAASVEPTVFVVDDDAEVRASLRYLLESASFAVETYASGAEFLAHHENHRAGCLVLDIRMPDMSGLELQEQLRATRISIPVIIMTAYADVAAALKAMKTGASDFLEKPFDDEVLLRAIRVALQRDAEVRARAAAKQEALQRLARLTPREREVLGLLVGGQCSREIAAKLHVAQKTVEAHRAGVRRKTRTDTIAELVRLVLEAGE